MTGAVVRPRQAFNENACDFRLDTMDEIWKSTYLRDQSEGHYSA